MPMVAKLGSKETFLDWSLPITSHDALITWSCKIM